MMLADMASSQGAAADVVGPGERDPVDAGMLGEGSPGHGPPAGHHVDDAGREPGFGGEPGQRHARRRGVVARLHDDRAPRRQRGRQFPGQQQQRRVPRGDRRDHAGRFALGVDEEVRLAGGNDLALDLVGEPVVIAVPVRQRPHLAGHLPQQLAGVACLPLGKPHGVPLDEGREAVQQATTRGRRQPAPRPAERGPSRAHGPVHILGPAVGDQGPRTARVGVGRLVGAAIGGGRGTATDPVVDPLEPGGCLCLVGNHGSSSEPAVAGRPRAALVVLVGHLAEPPGLPEGVGGVAE